MRNNDLALDSRFSWALETIEQLKRESPSLKNVFDIGSGNELMRVGVEALGMNYFSFDLCPPNEQVREWDIENPFPYAETADIIIFLEVIEHLNNPWLSMRNIYNVLNDQGHIIISTPNPGWSGSRLYLLGKGYLGFFTESDLKLNHHVFIAWPHIVQYLLMDTGFSDIKLKQLGKSTGLFAYPFLGLKTPLRIGYRLLKKFIEAFDKNAIGAMYGVLAKKKGIDKNNNIN
jgi:SAM-dependent methyltransferase